MKSYEFEKYFKIIEPVEYNIDYFLAVKKLNILPSFTGSSVERNFNFYKTHGFECSCCKSKVVKVVRTKDHQDNTLFLYISENGWPLTRDHLKPKSIGGKGRGNYYPLCFACNQIKKNMKVNYKQLRRIMFNRFEIFDKDTDIKLKRLQSALKCV